MTDISCVNSSTRRLPEAGSSSDDKMGSSSSCTLQGESNNACEKRISQRYYEDAYILLTFRHDALARILPLSLVFLFFNDVHSIVGGGRSGGEGHRNRVLLLDLSSVDFANLFKVSRPMRQFLIVLFEDLQETLS